MENLLKKIKYKEWLLFIGIVLLYLAFEVIFLLFGVNFKNITLEDYLLIIFTKYLVIILLLILLYHKYLKEKWFDFKKNFKKHFSIAFKNYLIGLLIMCLTTIIISYIISGNGRNEQNVQTLIRNVPLVAFIITTIIAPFIEEMIFRKSLQDCFSNPKLYMIISGLIFGYIHVMSSKSDLEYLLIIPYGVMGLMFAKTVHETDNIYPSILMHLLHNGILTIIAVIK